MMPGAMKRYQGSTLRMLSRSGLLPGGAGVADRVCFIVTKARPP